MAADAEAIRDLHAPSEGFGLVCDGCDSEGWESEPPAWPCRTAALVYSEAEIAEVTATYNSWRRWVDDAERRKNLATGWSFNDDMRQSIIRMMTTRSPLMELARRSPALAGQAVAAQSGAGDVVKLAQYVQISQDAAARN